MMIKLSTLLEAQNILAESLASDKLKAYQRSFNDKRMGMSYRGNEFQQNFAKNGVNNSYYNNQELYDYVMQWNVPVKVYKSLFDYLNKEVPELNKLEWDKVKDEDIKPLKFVDKNGDVKKSSLNGKLVFWEDYDGNLIAVSYDNRVVMVVCTENVALAPSHHQMQDIIKRKKELSNTWSNEGKALILQDFLDMQQKMVVYSPKTREMKLFPGGKAELAHKQIGSLCPGAAYYIDAEFIENNQDFDKSISREEWRIELNKQLNMAKFNIARYKTEIRKRQIDKNSISSEIDKMFVILTKYVRFVRNLITNNLSAEDDNFKDVALAKHKSSKRSYESGLNYLTNESNVLSVYEFLRCLNKSMNYLLICKQLVPKNDPNASAREIADNIRKFSICCSTYNNIIQKTKGEYLFHGEKLIDGKSMSDAFGDMPMFMFISKDHLQQIKGTNLSKISAPEV